MRLVFLLPYCALLATGLVLAWMMRRVGGYPNCPSDEHNWTLIADQVSNGVQWPVSGPLHFGLVQTLAGIGGWEFGQVLVMMGIVSVPILLGIIAIAYTRLGVGKPINVVVVLACSSYFLAPLIESRPQQWGQVLVLLGLVLSWRAMNRLGSWWHFAVVLLVVASLHILSFAVLVTCTLVVWAILYLLYQTSLSDGFKLSACILLGLLVFVIPGGPYTSMLEDLWHNHLQLSGQRGAFLVLLLTSFTICLTLLLGPWRRSIKTWLTFAWLAMCRQSPWIWLCFLLVAFGALLMQTFLLPSEAWLPYGHFSSIFWFSQSGNLLFMALGATGFSISARDALHHGKPDPLARACVILTLAVCAVALLALLLSFWMRDNNWMLRVINYGIFFPAVFASLALQRIRSTAIRWGLCLLAISISTVSVIRPPGLYYC